MPNNYNAATGYFLYVGDISEVYNYNVPQGNAMFFMNKSQPVMYLKSVNMFNQQTVTTYDLLERKAEVPVISNPIPPSVPSSNSPYVTRDEIASIIQESIRNEMRNKGGYRNKKEEG